MCVLCDCCGCVWLFGVGVCLKYNKCVCVCNVGVGCVVGVDRVCYIVGCVLLTCWCVCACMLFNVCVVLLLCVCVCVVVVCVYNNTYTNTFVTHYINICWCGSNYI